MSKLYNKSGILGCKSPQKAGNSPQTGRKMVLPAQECENLENSTYGTHLAAPFAAPAQCAAGVKTGNGAVEQCAAVENLDTAAHAQSVAGGKFANGVELGVAERCYVAGDETNSILSGSSVKTQQISINTHKCFVQKVNKNTNTAGRTAKKHSKILRAVACGCLAILMCGTAFLGTACGSTPANVGFNGGGAGGSAPSANMGQGSAAGADQNFATQGGGLITPRADDPVIFETKNGLEIKFGFDYSTLGSGALAGFPYFNTIDPNGVNYTWVIIGKNPNITNYHSLLLYNHEYNMPDALTFNFVPMPESSIENLTPAGQAIYAHLSKMKYNYPGNNYDLSLTNLISNAEIPANCVLCMLNGSVGELRKLSNIVNWCAGEIVDLETVADAHCSISELGLTSIQSQIRTMTLVTHSWNDTYRNDPARIFSFGCEPNSSFKYISYLTQSQLAISTSDKIVLRDGYHTYHNAYLIPQGHSIEVGTSNIYKVRPLFVMSMV